MTSRQTSNGQVDGAGGGAGADSSEALVSAMTALEKEADLIIDGGTDADSADILVVSAAAEAFVSGEANKNDIAGDVDEAVVLDLLEGGGGEVRRILADLPKAAAP